MTKEHSFVAGDYSDRDLYTSSRTQERALNSAIVRAEISESFEEYVEIFEAFCADDIEVSSETAEEPVRGKDRVRSLLVSFLVPLHVMAEVGGLSISIRQTAIPGDVADETHSAWTLDLVGVSGRTCTVTWPRTTATSALDALGKKCKFYCTKPTFGAGVLPSGDSLIVPN